MLKFYGFYRGVVNLSRKIGMKALAQSVLSYLKI